MAKNNQKEKEKKSKEWVGKEEGGGGGVGGITWPGPSLAILISSSGSLNPILMLENSGRESWLQVNEVYVFDFEVELEFESSDSK